MSADKVLLKTIEEHQREIDKMRAMLSRKEQKAQAVRRDQAEQNLIVSKEDAKKLSKAYYDEGFVFGRDNLYHIMKTKYPKKEDRPSRRTVMKWLKKQKIHQEFSGTRSGGTTNFFYPVSPFYSLSMDLLDFNNKPSMNYRYVLVVIDNFSRWMATVPITGKKASKTAPAMEKIFEKIKEEHGQEALDAIKYVNTDDGGEFKKEFIPLMEGMKTDKRPKGIKIRRALGGHPAQNGMVERQNGRLKMILAKLIKINGGSWHKHLQKATDINNKQKIRTTEYTPNEALELKPDEYKKLIQNVKDNRDEDIIITKEWYKVGEKVRLKLNKSTLGKASTPNWSAKVFTIAKVVKNNNPQIADKYLIEGRGKEQFYSRNDLQRVREVEDIPIKLNEEQKKQIADYLRLDETSIVDGEFSEETIEKAKEAFEKKYPESIDEGAKKTKEQLKRLKENSKPEDVVRPKRERKKTIKRLDPSAQKKEKPKEFKIERLDAVRTKNGETEYFVKWEGYDEDENTWELEFFPKKGKKKRERNIPISFVKDFKERNAED